jgi:antitoxin (DNA-binding transcriptional repressor) of toxin-antitoxin stability system
VVTRRGKPAVKVVPVEPENDSIFGFMKGKGVIVGDIDSPIPLDEWKIMKIKKK